MEFVPQSFYREDPNPEPGAARTHIFSSTLVGGLNTQFDYTAEIFPVRTEGHTGPPRLPQLHTGERENGKHLKAVPNFLRRADPLARYI